MRRRKLRIGRAQRRDLCPHYSSPQSSAQSKPSPPKHSGFLLELRPPGFFGGDSGRAKPMLQRSHRSLLFQLSRPGVSDPEPGLEMATFIGFEVGWNAGLGQVTIRPRAVKQSSCVPQLLSCSHHRASSLQSAVSKPAGRTRYEDSCPLPGFVCQGPSWSFWL